MDFISTLLKGSEYAVKQYNKMSSAMWAPEGYIRDMCAQYIHEQLQVSVSIEVSYSFFKGLWDLDEKTSTELHDELRGFQIDLATHHLDKNGEQTVAALVEFKLYTGPGAVADLQRLRTLVKLAQNRGKLAEGYLVICEQVFPSQGVDFVQQAFNSFSKQFRFAARTSFEIDETLSLDREGVRRSGRWPVGVGVINVRNI